ncbi:BON domain-containing protein [Pseudanabaena yagii]|uniref:BON domain-containing protein n=1 Tax=Pseudanabaena yagii GIHE-NHR1 TaxID=2722753 RepID=A0ABX1LZT4_9CYAN|nr:BON domain-containing protein [Pseudanabaena yagii]NMF60219.1 BON domain-containing protein [Pseudanabaena yagii GIHE-NHR1]
MNRKVVSSFLIGFVVVAVGACTEARTTSDAPTSTDQKAQTPIAQSTEPAKTDAQSDTRAKQLDADIRAKEQRNNVMGNPPSRNDNDLASEVRSKLEANIPSGNLTVSSKDAVVTVSGTVSNLEQLTKIQKLAMEIKGVKSVTIKAVVATKSN